MTLSENVYNIYDGEGKIVNKGYYEEDVKEELIKSINEMQEEYLKNNEFVNPILILERNFGKELCEEEKQDENS